MDILPKLIADHYGYALDEIMFNTKVTEIDYDNGVYHVRTENDDEINEFDYVVFAGSLGASINQIKLPFIPREQLDLIKSIPFMSFCNVFVVLEDHIPASHFVHYLSKSKFYFTFIEYEDRFRQRYCKLQAIN